MAQRDPERYTQGDDGLIAEKVGSWAVDKLKIVTDYVYASRSRADSSAHYTAGSPTTSIATAVRLRRTNTATLDQIYAVTKIAAHKDSARWCAR